jgi:hypothetical protein
LALGKITTLFEQNFLVLLDLHAFGHHFESQAVAENHHHGGDGSGKTIAPDAVQTLAAHRNAAKYRLHSNFRAQFCALPRL